MSDALKWLETVVCSQTATDILAHRKSIKMPLTDRAAKIAAKQLSLVPPELREDAVDMWVSRGWRGFEASWFFKSHMSQQQRFGVVGAAIDMVMKDGSGNTWRNSYDDQQLPAIAKH